MSKKRIAVVGAGIAGLTCAYELQEAGFDVVVYEKEEYVGGRMSSRTKGNLTFDIGANHLVNLYTEMRKYCEKFNIEWQRFSYVNYRVLVNGELKKPFDAVSFKDKAKLALAYKNVKDIPMTFLDSSTLVEFDDENEDAYAYAKEHIGETFADNIVDTYTGVYQFHHATEISKAGLFSQLNSTKNQQADWYLHRTTGGMITLPNAFAERLAVHKGTPVTSVKSIADGKVEITTDNGSKMFDAVVMASTSTVSKKIYQNPTDGQRAVLDVPKYAPSIEVAFKVPHDIMGPTSGPECEDTVSAVWIPHNASTVLSSYCNEAYKGPEMIKDGKSLLIAFFHEDGANEYLTKSDEDVYAVAKEELMKTCPYITDVSVLEPYDIYRWEEAMPKYYPGSITKVKHFLDTDQGKQNVWFCGDFLNSTWTEGALRCGQRVAAQMAEHYA